MIKYLKKYNHFLCYFLIGCILTYPFIIKAHYDFDAYSLFDIGYNGYASLFMLSARVFSALFYSVFALLKIPYDVIAIGGIIVSNIFIALSCYTFEKILNNYEQVHKSDMLVFILAISLIFFNFFTMEYFGFMESFVICMGMYLLTLSMNVFLKNTKKNYLISLLLAVLAILCYQGIMSIFIPLLAYLVYLQNQSKDIKTQILLFIKRGIVAILIYGICHVISFAIMKGYVAFSGMISLKEGSIDIFHNLSMLPSMMKETYTELFRYFSPTYFYIALSLLLLINFVKALVTKNMKVFIFLIVIILCCFLAPFIPNIFLPDNSNYVSPRVVLALPMAIGISALFFFNAYQKEIKLLRIGVIVIIIVFSLLNAWNYNTTLRYGNMKHEEDKILVDAIYRQIQTYEEQNGIEINNISYAKDDSVSYFYNYKTRNSYTYRMYAYPWAVTSAINGFWDGRKFEFEEMSSQKRAELFGEPVNYDELNDKQFVFDGDTLFLLLF